MPIVPIDPLTGLPWVARPDTDTATRYLIVEHGLTVKSRTLANLRGTGRGPEWQYIGNTPTTTLPALDAYAAAARTDISPRKRNRLARETAAA